MYITQTIVVKWQWGVSHFVVWKKLFFFLIHWIRLNPSPLTIHPLFCSPTKRCVYICGRFFMTKKCVRPIRLSVWVCACLVCCCCSEWEAATLFGSEERFPCLSPSASALAAPSVYKTLSAIVLLHGTAAVVDETTTGPFTFSPLFNKPKSLVTTVRRRSWAQFKD